MIAIVSAADVVPEVRAEHHSVTNYVGHNREPARGPQAFLVALPPGHVIEPHFHLTDQFQIFLRGHASMGKHGLDPVTVHYADSFTPYGPIRGGEHGFAFFNLRTRSDTGAHWMPASRHEMPRRAGRGLTAHARLSLQDAVGPMRLETIVEPHDDGLGVWEVVAGPGARLMDETAGGSGRYQLVLAGSLCADGRTLPVESCIFASPGERLERRYAGPEGVHLLEAQLPGG